MGELFKGWRRKIGVMTLLIACVFMAGWVRSLSTSDSLELMRITHRKESIASVSSYLVWRIVEPPSYLASSPAQGPKISWNSTPLPVASSTQISASPIENEKTWTFYGLSHTEFTFMGARYLLRSVSYSYPTMILTLLSAVLLHSKPRPTSPQKFPDTPPADRA